MTTALTTKAENSVIEKVIIEGDLSQLSPGERLNYYRSVCDSLGLNPLTKPFDYIRLNNRLVLYAKRDATDQLRKIHGVSVSITSRERIEDVYVVSAKAATKDGREDESIGAVNILNLKGDTLANALMKAETKAKRRVTLSIVGLGWLDETEIETIPDAKPVIIETPTNESVSDGQSFAALEDLLYQLNLDFGLTEVAAKNKLRELGFTTLPKNGELKARLSEMYQAVKAAI